MFLDWEFPSLLPSCRFQTAEQPENTFFLNIIWSQSCSWAQTFLPVPSDNICKLELWVVRDKELEGNRFTHTNLSSKVRKELHLQSVCVSSRLQWLTVSCFCHRRWPVVSIIKYCTFSLVLLRKRAIAGQFNHDDWRGTFIALVPCPSGMFPVWAGKTPSWPT